MTGDPSAASRLGMTETHARCQADFASNAKAFEAKKGGASEPDAPKGEISCLPANASKQGSELFNYAMSATKPLTEITPLASTTPCALMTSPSAKNQTV